MLADLVSIPTDKRPLDGLLYRSKAAGSGSAALIMHGNAMNFYYGPSQFLPPAFGSVGLDSLDFNRHGHDTISAYSRVVVRGDQEDAERYPAARFANATANAEICVIGHCGHFTEAMNRRLHR